MYVYIHTHTHTHTLKPIHTHTHTHTHMCVCVCVCVQKLHVTINDILVENVPEGPQLSLFYRGLALKLAQSLSIARSESMRLSMLKSFNDRQVFFAYIVGLFSSYSRSLFQQSLSWPP